MKIKWFSYLIAYIIMLDIGLFVISLQSDIISSVCYSAIVKIGLLINLSLIEGNKQ